MAGSASLTLTGVTASSDATWVTPGIDAANKELTLQFSTTGLVAASSTATITVGQGSDTETLLVKAGVSTMNIVRLLDDPVRSRTYALHQNGTNAGAVVFFEPLKGTTLGCLTVGKKPTDMDIKQDGSELLVVSTASKSLTAVDLTQNAINGTIQLTAFTDCGDANATAHVAYGSGNIIYYTDADWAPTLRVLNRSSNAVLQSTLLDNSFGFGDIAVSTDHKSLFGWALVGWSAGMAGSEGRRFTIGADGTLTAADITQVPSYPNGMTRDPVDTPALVSQDGRIVILKQYAFSTSSLSDPVTAFTSPVYAISPNANIVSTSSAIYDFATGNELYTLPSASTVQVITSDYSRLVYFDPTAKAIKTVDLFLAIGADKLGLSSTPANGAIVLPPDKLQWTPIAGVDTYDVYFGTSSSAVSSAGVNSASYVGRVSGSTYSLSQTLTPGTTYYWRVDSVQGSNVTPGYVNSFTVATLSLSKSSINLSTVAVSANNSVQIDLASANSVSWSASTKSPWVTFAQTSGKTPATLQVILDATKAAVGSNIGAVTLTSGGSSFDIPVNLQVDPLNITVIRSDASSTKVYAISEATTTGGISKAYLLEIDTLLQKVTHSVPVGSSATDLAIHHGDNRIYVPNWKTGGILAVSLTTFQVEKTIATPPFSGVGYSKDDVYKLSAGSSGRLITEGENQFVDLQIFDTASGTSLATFSLEEGCGQYAPGGRYYYHGDDGSTGAGIHKLDTTGDILTEIKSVEISGISYYGSRNIVVSEDGSRVFWNGGVFDTDLNLRSMTDEEVLCASADGRYAFSQSKIYDIQAGTVLATLPVSATVSAFNTTTGCLVLENGSAISYSFPLGSKAAANVTSPLDGAIVLAPSSLQWQAITGVDSYQIYLGTSQAAVAAATSTSPQYLGSVTGSSINLSTPPVAGTTYYWRVDYVIGGQVVATRSQSFIASTIAPSVSVLSGSTVVGFTNYTLSTNLTSASAGSTWTASTSNPWISFASTTGATPSSLQIQIDASQLTPGINSGSVVVTDAGGKSFTLPVSVQVDPLTVTVLRSDSASSMVYAISESAATSGSSRAYLLEVDSQLKKITRAVAVGSSATDLAIHHGDNRIYVPNWKTGGILAVNLTSFQVEQTIATPPFSGVGYSTDDAYKVAAGSAGRLITEGANQWIAIRLYDTVQGKFLAKAGGIHYAGGGAYDPTGRYYYHFPSINSVEKFDTAGDTFTQVSNVEVSSATYSTNNLVISDDGTRIFCGGAMFDKDLNLLWTTNAAIYATSADGKYAFGATSIYDTTLQKAILGMPATTTSTIAYNSTPKELVVPQNGTFAFYSLGSMLNFVAPTLSLGSKDSSSVTLNWTDNNLELSFTLQMRVAGDTSWTDVSSTIAQNQTSYNVTGLTAGKTYEFRVEADSPNVHSDWSNILQVELPSVSGPQIRNVTDIKSLTDALAEADLNHGATYTINLAAGTYALSSAGFAQISGSQTVLKGPTGVGSDAILDCAGFSGDTVFDVTGSYASFSFMVFQNLHTHGITARPSADHGTVSACDFQCTGSASAITGQGCDDWLLFADDVEGVAKGSATAEPGVSFGVGSSNVEISGSLFLNCDQAIGITSTNTTNVGQLWIGNNMISDVRSSSSAGPGIVVTNVNSSTAVVENNTIYQLGQNTNAIEYRSCPSALTIWNNLTNKPIANLGSASANLKTNNSHAVASWFRDPSKCDLRLTGSITGVVDAGTTVADLTFDIEGDARPTGSAYDIGADEYVPGSYNGSSSSSSSSSGSSSSGSGGQSGGGGGGAPSLFFVGALVALAALRKFGRS